MKWIFYYFLSHIMATQMTPCAFLTLTLGFRPRLFRIRSKLLFIFKTPVLKLVYVLGVEPLRHEFARNGVAGFFHCLVVISEDAWVVRQRIPVHFVKVLLQKVNRVGVVRQPIPVHLVKVLLQKVNRVGVSRQLTPVHFV